MNIIDAARNMRPSEGSTVEHGASAGKFIPGHPARGAIHPWLKGYAYLGPDGDVLSSVDDKPIKLHTVLLDSGWELLELEELRRIANRSRWHRLSPAPKIAIPAALLVTFILYMVTR